VACHSEQSEESQLLGQMLRDAQHDKLCECEKLTEFSALKDCALQRERSLKMQYMPVVLKRAIITILFPCIVSGTTDFDKASLVEQTIEAVKSFMVQSPSPWPDEWKQEYIETIRKEIDLHRDVTHFDLRLEILRKGFGPYWEGLTKTRDSSLFDVYRTRIRWYTEHLMGTKFPNEEERKKLHNQYTDIWIYAANSLVEQFPFLDPNTVQIAKQDDLSECYSKIDAPLIPVYLRPMSEAQVEQIKQRWDKLRYARVDLLRRLGDSSTTLVDSRDAPLSSAKRDYELTKESLSQLLGLVWMVVPQRPDYYLNALENHTKVAERRFQSERQARSDQQRLEKERSRQLLQTEHISFVLSALLETPQYLEGIPSIITQKQSPLEQQDKTAKGGDAYELKNGLQE